VNNTRFKHRLAQLWAEIIKADAEKLFGCDSHLLRNESADDRTAQPGFVGARYRRGGLLFIGMNPGGRVGRMTAADQPQFRLLKALRNASTGTRLAKFVELNRALSQSMQAWAVCKPAKRILEALGLSFSQIAFLNLVKWRTRGERVSARVLRKSWECQVSAQIELLEPCGIVSLGKAAGKAVNRFSPDVSFNRIIPRRRGDRGEPPEQKRAVAATIRFLKNRI
jgi:hypothetical protein